MREATAEDWMGRYEDLRREQLEGGRGWGLALFLHQGMAAWMRACSMEVSCDVTSVHTTFDGLGNQEGETILSEMADELRYEMTSHIVSMIQSRMEMAA